MEQVLATLGQLITPAIVVSVGGYLIYFFGQAIADQQPFADDRRWHAQLAGVYFFVNVISLPAVLGVVAAWKWDFLASAHWTRLIIVSFIGAFVLISNQIMGGRVYKKDSGMSWIFGKEDKDKKAWRKYSPFFSVLILLIQAIFVVVLAWCFASELETHSIAWIVVSSIEIFLAIFFIAVHYSLFKTKIPKVDIYFINERPPLHGVLLLKVNVDNIRVRTEDKVMIINKNEVLRIDMPAPSLMEWEKYEASHIS